ncbi:MAG: hypothetical protein AAF081_19965, partial [Actinomycetota bacterium]
DETYDVQAAIDAHRARFGVSFAWLAVGLFVIAGILLAGGVWNGGQNCGSALSNPGWPDGSDCYLEVYRRALVGWTAAILGTGSLLAAARYSWGPGWYRQRRVDGLRND